MVKPPFLQPGDRIAMISVAGKVNREIVEAAKDLLETENYIVEIGANSFGSLHMFSGTDSERASDIQKALDDPGVKAIFFNRGGYGSLRTIMLLDWTAFYLHPKWLIGFSDITVFHSFLSKNDLPSIHGVMPAFFFENGARTESLDILLGLLRGKPLNYQIMPHDFNRCGKSRGVLTGGNLSLLYSLRGTILDQSLDGKVLFLEDIAEYDYHIDRMMMNLKFGGVLANLAGLVIGYFTDTKSSSVAFGSTAAEIIREAVSGYGYPVAFGFPAGHELPNYPLLMGSEVVLEVTAESVRISQPF